MYDYDGSIDWNMYFGNYDIIFVWVCSEYQIYNNEHSAEEKLNTPRLSRLVCSTENALLVGS